MQVEAARTNLIIITSMGLAMFLLGLFLYFNASRIAPYMRYLLPLPPISVAAYIYVLNVVGAKGDRALNISKDLLVETVIGTVSFVLITVLLLGQYYMISLLLRK
ncbi:MAG: hypothetical protein QNJ54_32470 [Prochloraceae cyanobacterium]|nr:hypothetical protein [Prochloraceae cyanobacterium]